MQLLLILLPLHMILKVFILDVISILNIINEREFLAGDYTSLRD